jgi:hypothetical protein
VRENICWNRATINQPSTERNRREERERGRCVVDYRVWTKTAKDEERICEEKSVTELSV